MSTELGARVDVHVHPTRYSRHGATFAEKNRIEFTPAGLLREMDAHGIGWGVFLCPRLAPSLADGLADVSAVARESRGRLLPTGTVDPTQGEAEVARALDLWTRNGTRLRGIKLYPGYHPFDVTDARLEPVYHWAEQHRVPVWVHQGDTSEPDGLLRFTRPILLDEVAVRWRSVRFVLCHVGNPWMEEAAEVVFKNENVYTDTSGLLNPFAEHYAAQVQRMRTRLRHAVLAVGDVRKVLYGSDWPISSIVDAVGLVDGLDLPRPDKELILGGNARELLGLPDAAPM
ncbi:MAG: amidohydrolase family protein [Thermoplasmata archaeon]|nr:amidohydrolase family protein [Thermoplasmata archaeon]